MTYQEALKYLYNALPMYQRIGAAAYKADLTNSHELDKHFNFPHRQFRSIHIAGTNGKGSVSHMLASVYQEAGYKVGLYTSPHLLDFRERVKINGEMVSEEFVATFVNENMRYFEDLKPSFFEITVFMAFCYFAKEKVDIAIIETGLGGRLDSTNVITPMISVITNIGLDHTQFLGNTLENIAKEKAGIIKKSVPVIIGEKQVE
ncbi:MAG: bifunctional folylpolyglutamate synthase/dihydrofolate synthase, partial [Bacteroidales bacterium]|nr:bifunctional folylpolyglutamate synthase/dihydrofolate synthase [Bacteroidales bacterium]